MNDTTERFLRIEEVQERLAIGRSKMFELLGDGTIKSVQIGRARRIAESEYERYVATLCGEG